MNADELHTLFLESAETEHWLPEKRQIARMAYWPDVQSEWLSYADPNTRVRLTPTTKQVSRYHLAIEYSSYLEDTDRALVWAVAYSAVNRLRGPKWRKLGRLLGKDHRTVQSRYMTILVRLSLKLKNRLP